MTGALWKSPTLRACVAYEATQKPEVECKERKEHESPPVALHTEEDRDEEDPRREKGAHDDRLFDVPTRPGIDPARPFVRLPSFRNNHPTPQCHQLKRHRIRRSPAVSSRAILRQRVDRPHEGTDS
jgi:hypothetical protein